MTMSVSRWQKYYSGQYQPVAPILMAATAIFSINRLRRQSLINRQKDYLGIASRPDLFRLHQKMNGLLAEGDLNWNSYDYGEGYFYQSYRKIGVTGFRDTEKRVDAMGLMQRVTEKDVFEIGSNAGFLSCQIAAAARSVDACEIAPHLVRIAQEAAAFERISNCRFQSSSFEDFPEQKRYDVVLSFANHSTYDGNTRQPLDEYLAKCRRMLVAGGIFLFESHPPQHEGRSHQEVVDCLAEQFRVEAAEVLTYGTFLDRDRLFVVARGRN